MWDKSYDVNRKSRTAPTLFVGIDLVRPEAAIARLVFLRMCLCWQGRDHAVEGGSDHGAIIRLALEDGLYLSACSDHGPNPPAPFCCEVADLDAARAVHGHRARVGWVLRFGDQLDWFAWCAELNIEAPAWPSAVGIVGADHGQGKRG